METPCLFEIEPEIRIRFNGVCNDDIVPPTYLFSFASFFFETHKSMIVNFKFLEWKSYITLALYKMFFSSLNQVYITHKL